MSDEARQLGNAAFAKYEFAKAISCYDRASELDPSDWHPPWNKSAVYFETGEYSLAIDYAERAQDLTEDEEVHRKILVRQAKAHLLLREHDDARRLIDGMTEHEEKRLLQEALDAKHRSSQVNATITHNPRDLPYYKPQVEPVSEFYNVGHDQAMSMLDPSVLEQCIPGETVAFLFGGIGDPRHLFQTFRMISELPQSALTSFKFHFMVNDIKPEVFA